MTRGVFAHLIICNEKCYKEHIARLSQENRLMSLEAFTTETAHTIFSEGIVIVAASTFEAEAGNFTAQLKEQVGSDTTPIHKAIINNAIYRRHLPSPELPCTLYAITPIAWSTMQVAEPSRLSVSKITL